MSRIDFKNISKRYAPGLPLTINNANLTIDKGEFCVFVGPSGCGKSTLLRMVAGLEDITAGDLSIGGKRVNDLPPAQRGVAMVFQSYALYPHMTVAENMAFGLRVMGSDKAEIDRKVQKAAAILQLGPLMERLPKALSGGQRQRVAIGRAIVKEPDVFLFDEPLSNLDAALRVQTRLEIAKLHHDIGTASMIYVTHDQVEAMTLADKIVLLRAGKGVETDGSVAQFGTPMDLYHRPQNLFVAEFIGSPKMNVLPGRFVRAEPDHAIVEVHGEQLKVCVDARAAQAGAPVSVGIRPEHLLAG
jgi:multiple sugar transport system ATP-binding protein